MRIQLDTTAKTVKVEGTVALSELMETIERLLPDNTWKEFKLESNTVIQHWHQPIYVQPYVHAPYTYPWITYTNGLTTGSNTVTTTGSDTFTYTSGTYNIEV
jgi:hypothetical protein